MERITPLKLRQQFMMLIIMLGVVLCFGIGAVDSLHFAQPAFSTAYLLWPLLTSIVLILSLFIFHSFRMMMTPVNQIESQIEELLRKDGSFQHSAENGSGRSLIISVWNRFIAQSLEQKSVTTRQKTESLSCSSQSNLQSTDLLDILPYGIAYFNRVGQITHHNPSFIQMLILERVTLTTMDEFLKTISPWISKEDRVRTQKNWKLAESLTITLEMKCGDNVDYIQMTRRPHVVHGRVVGTLIITNDITRQRISDVSRDHFLSTATHELRTPLANIIAYAETLTSNENIDRYQQKHFCNIIRDESIRLARFVDELLDINRMEAGSLTLRCSQVEMLPFLHNTCDKIRPMMHGKRIEFTTRFPASTPTLIIDQDKVASALINLLGNAAKYTPEKGRVELRAIVLEHCVCFEVKDSGIGIAADELSQVFDKFFRSDDDRVREITGSGLGLSFTREVVRLHGGDITVQSKIGKGSTFIMTIPRS